MALSVGEYDFAFATLLNIAPMIKDDSYDVVVVGTGFASTFFLQGLLNKTQKRLKILVLEAGPRLNHATLLASKRMLHLEGREHFRNRNQTKPWNFSRAFGGGSNCWFATTPRMLPQDFRLRSDYGVGEDWPIGYDDLEEHYSEAEQLMQVCGPRDPLPYRMSRPYFHEPHLISTVDKLLQSGFPQYFMPLPSARRPHCCGSGVCYLCPVDAKFRIEKDMPSPFVNEGVEVRYESPALRLLHQQGRATHVVYQDGGRERQTRADLFVLGANAIFNPAILLRSGLEGAETGRGLNEQVGYSVDIDLAGLVNQHGSTVTTGLGLNDHFGAHRKNRAAFMYQTSNRATSLRLERGKWLHRTQLLIMIEDLRRPDNRVEVDSKDGRPIVHYTGHSDYAQKTVAVLEHELNKLLAALPVEAIGRPVLRPTESHIQCTTVMGRDPVKSVVDSRCVHHHCRNLVVLGSGNFPTASPANPSLTVSALSLYAASKLTM